MKCRKCDQKAVFNMRHHKLALCRNHYLEWFVDRTQQTIQRYQMFGPQDPVLVAVSGGKDSLSLWDVVLRLGYRADGLYIGLGIDGGISYSQKSCDKVKSFVEKWPGVVLHVVDVENTYGKTIPEMAELKRHGKPCSVCGLTKRYIMNRVAVEGGYAALATAHNLDDEVAVLMQNVLHWQPGYLARQHPLLEATHPGLARKVKPFFRFYERESAAYALLRGIDYIYEECPYSVGSTTIASKELLNQLEAKSPGAKLHFFLSFLKARERGDLIFQKDDGVLHPCDSCGQPTSTPGLCTFCRTWQREPIRLYTPSITS